MVGGPIRAGTYAGDDDVGGDAEPAGSSENPSMISMRTECALPEVLPAVSGSSRTPPETRRTPLPSTAVPIRMSLPPAAAATPIASPHFPGGTVTVSSYSSPPRSARLSALMPWRRANSRACSEIGSDVSSKPHPLALASGGS
jgi:hypothetical protein